MIKAFLRGCIPLGFMTGTVAGPVLVARNDINIGLRMFFMLPLAVLLFMCIASSSQHSGE